MLVLILLIKKYISFFFTNSDSFDWLKVLRYYWDEHLDDCVTRMSSAHYVYGYEYLGASGVLVITPLTDRCYLCLMGALQLDLGQTYPFYLFFFPDRIFQVVHLQVLLEPEKPKPPKTWQKI